MPPVAMRAFKTALERGTPDAVYLLHGDNDFLKDEKVRDLIVRLSDPGTRDFNLDQVRGGELDGARFASVLDALPMMAERRLVVVRDIGALKKDAKAALDRYLARPSAETVLVMVAAAGWKADASMMERASTLELRTLTDDEAVTWIGVRATALGATIADDAARLLVRAVGSDLAMLDGELRKLQDYVAGATIDAAAVQAIVGVRAGETMVDLLDTVCARDGARAASLVEHVLSQPKSSGVVVVMALTSHLLGLGQAMLVRSRGTHPRQVASELFALMGEAKSTVVGRPWGDAVSAWSRHAERWDEDSIARGLRALAAADRALKDAGVSDEARILETLLLDICQVRRARVA
jgi:DNA polymerase-3 subunit delta